MKHENDRQVRDFDLERRWLLGLPPGPDTDRKQDEWESDPEVIEWRLSVGPPS